MPRGYAVALLDLVGTRNSTGCLDIGGPAEIENSAQLVEWLNGKGVARDLDGNEVTADWSNGLSAIVGKSWDGTVANGVASLGVEGLATIVPITAISSWHKYYWNNGARYSGTPLNLADNIRNVPAAAARRFVTNSAPAGKTRADHRLLARALLHPGCCQREGQRLRRRWHPTTTTSSRTTLVSGGTHWPPTTCPARSGCR